MKEFLAILIITPLAFFLLAFPLLSLLSSQSNLALASSDSSPWAHDIWWDRWYSWIAFAGPPGRWVVGTALGYWALDQDVIVSCDGLGCVVKNPHLQVLATACYGFLLGIFCLVRALGLHDNHLTY